MIKYVNSHLACLIVDVLTTGAERVIMDLIFFSIFSICVNNVDDLNSESNKMIK